MRAEVFVDPFEEAEAEVQKERANLLNKDAQKEADAKKEALAKPKAYGTGVGKYINPQNKRPAGDVCFFTAFVCFSFRLFNWVTFQALPSTITLKKKAIKTSLTDFSAW
ncbi:hypothetical protein ANCDUO_19578 [Ancylostoma duodenale]|uniref:Uncharacterized protein n=1 Tax=Ancylostoma duodenale TaxID=51022 RepID=A0A0C2FUI3_9BILA|nr:hypothetical protein ANCDUO_19578 [Ancylostoma duodenale]